MLDSVARDFCFHWRRTNTPAHPRRHTRTAVESQYDNRKEGRFFSSRALVCCTLSFIFWEASRRKFMGPCPRRSARDSSLAPFLAFVLTLQLTGCFLKILVCACFISFLCQVPWVVAHSDWNHIHVFMSAAPTIFYFLFFFF